MDQQVKQAGRARSSRQNERTIGLMRPDLLRRLLSLLFFVAAVASPLGAKPAAFEWKVTTWNLEWFPSGKPNFRDAKIEAERTDAAAKVLRELDPDIILLQEVRDEAAMEALCAKICRGHQVVVVSRFKQGNRISEQQQAILAKFPAKAAYWKEWTTRQLVNPPRGYAFALFEPKEGPAVAVYSLHLKSNAMGRDVPDRAKQETLNRLQRELGAQQLIEHLREIEALPDLAPKAAIVGGDFNTDPTQKRFAEERTLPLFAEAGFRFPILDLPIAQRTTIPGKGRYPDTTFDYLLFRGLKEKGKPMIVPTEISDHRPVTYVVVIR
jgi:endonuclease/exonuclease/phosphatase family metal-dependent hydrolase